MGLFSFRDSDVAPWHAEVDALKVELVTLRAEVRELQARRDPEEPTIVGLPDIVRRAIDTAVPPWSEDRTSLRVRSRLLRGARVRLKAHQTDAEVAAWISGEGDE